MTSPVTGGTVLVVLTLLPLALLLYAYLIYPVCLRIVGWLRPPSPEPVDLDEWPRVSIVLPAYNEEQAVRRTLETLLALEYPPARREILVVSDASTDRTDDIVREYAGQGVGLLRLEMRSGKTAAENAAAGLITGELVVNTDATIRILPGSLKPLVRAFQDPTVGVASGRDVSVGDIAIAANRGESRYVGYEMWVRRLETRVGSIVGASGCFYAIRRPLHQSLFPEALSRDFASALIAREHGYRAVSVDEAICLVPRTISLQREYVRKVRTMARGLETLWFKRPLLDPFRYGSFAWMLFSHKLCRWLVFLAAPFAFLALTLLALGSGEWRALWGVVCGVVVVGAVAMRLGEAWRLPAPIALCGFAVASLAAGLQAWRKALQGERNPIWEPTRRPV